MPRQGFAERLLPSSKKNIPYLDAIRGMAVVFILIRHAWGLSAEPNYQIFGHSLSPFLMMMSSGVDLFFVLSGVLLAGRFLRADAQGRPAPSYTDYMKARILRIGPPYWVILGLVLLIFTPTMIPNDRVWSAHGAFMVLAHATFTQSLFIVSFGAYMVDSPFWTLTIEMAFYAVLPFAVRAFYRFRWWQGVIAGVAITSAWLYLCRYSMGWLVDGIRSHTFGLAYSESGVRFFLSRQLFGYLPHFAIGCAIAAILQLRPQNAFTRARAGVAYLLSGLAILAVAMGYLGQLSVLHGFANPEHLLSDPSAASVHYYFLESMPFAVAYGLIILGASLAPQAVQNRIASIPGLALFGVLGYSIYLIHMPLLYVLSQHALIASVGNPAWHLPVLLGVGTIVVLAISYGLFVAVERPAMMLSASVKIGDSKPFHILEWLAAPLGRKSEVDFLDRQW